MFNRDIVFDLLKRELSGKYGKTTREHGFLYVIQHIITQGYNVEALPIATNLDLVSLNSLEDLSDFL